MAVLTVGKADASLSAFEPQPIGSHEGASGFSVERHSFGSQAGASGFSVFLIRFTCVILFLNTIGMNFFEGSTHWTLFSSIA
jgi:hypothetical protein